MAPTAPDTLPCFPFLASDPFVITESPHLYFAGNQPAFATSLVQQKDADADAVTRVICVPKFGETGQVVLVDMATLVPEVVTFDTGDLGSA